MYSYNLYLAGSISIWKEQFVPKYASNLNNKVGLFEPGTLNVPADHTEISPFVTKRCVDEIKRADAVLSYMKPYQPGLREGVPGVDSSWECGFAHGLGKPVVALVDDLDHFLYFEDQWMLSHNKSAFLTSDKAVEEYALNSSHYDDPTILLFSDPSEIEDVIAAYLNSILNV